MERVQRAGQPASAKEGAHEGQTHRMRDTDTDTDTDTDSLSLPHTHTHTHTHRAPLPAPELRQARLCFSRLPPRALPLTAPCVLFGTLRLFLRLGECKGGCCGLGLCHALAEVGARRVALVLVRIGETWMEKGNKRGVHVSCHWSLSCGW